MQEGTAALDKARQMLRKQEEALDVKNDKLATLEKGELRSADGPGCRKLRNTKGKPRGTRVRPGGTAAKSVPGSAGGQGTPGGARPPRKLKPARDHQAENPKNAAGGKPEGAVDEIAPASNKARTEDGAGGDTQMDVQGEGGGKPCSLAVLVFSGSEWGQTSLGNQSRGLGATRVQPNRKPTRRRQPSLRRCRTKVQEAEEVRCRLPNSWGKTIDRGSAAPHDQRRRGSGVKPRMRLEAGTWRRAEDKRRSERGVMQRGCPTVRSATAESRSQSPPAIRSSFNCRVGVGKPTSVAGKPAELVSHAGRVAARRLGSGKLLDLREPPGSRGPKLNRDADLLQLIRTLQMKPGEGASRVGAPMQLGAAN